MNNCATCRDDGGPCAKCGYRIGDIVTGKGWSGFNTPHLTSTTATATKSKSEVGPGMFNFKGCDHRAAQPAVVIDRKSHGKLYLYGAQGAKLADPHARLGHLDVVLDLAGLVKQRKTFIVDGPPKFKSLNREIGPAVVRFDWPDMTAPVHVPLHFWQALLYRLPQHTAIACIGGHGRTGTALAALLIASGMDPTLAIATVREKHCNKAIETQGQESYLKGLRA